MRNLRSSAALVAAAVVAGGLALATPAIADPTPAGTFRQLVGVGSDTTQDVVNALAGDTVNGTCARRGCVPGFKPPRLVA